MPDDFARFTFFPRPLLSLGRFRILPVTHVTCADNSIVFGSKYHPAPLHRLKRDTGTAPYSARVGRLMKSNYDAPRSTRRAVVRPIRQSTIFKCRGDSWINFVGRVARKCVLSLTDRLRSATASTGVRTQHIGVRTTINRLMRYFSKVNTSISTEPKYRSFVQSFFLFLPNIRLFI